jgi:hypothetical protein
LLTHGDRLLHPHPPSYGILPILLAGSQSDNCVMYFAGASTCPLSIFRTSPSDTPSLSANAASDEPMSPL